MNKKKIYNQNNSTSMNDETIYILAPKEEPNNEPKKIPKEKISTNFISRKKKNRQINSLDELSKKFIKYALEANSPNINLNIMMKKIKAKKRRIYDITNVLEGNYI